MPYREEKDIAADLQDRSSSSEDLEDCPLTADENTRFPLNQRRRLLYWPAKESPFWKYYSLFTTTFSLLLLIALVHYKSTAPSTSKSTSSSISPTPHCSHRDEPFSNDQHLSEKEQLSTENPLKNYPQGVASLKKDNLVETRFYRDLRFMTLDHDSDYLWQEHLLMATGNIRLPPADGKGNASLKGIAMFHQMHCLAKMRMVLQLAKEGVDIGTDWSDDAHWPHCFDYLRESIMCYADPTLESVSLQPGPLDNGKFVKVIDGGAEIRYCRDTKPLYELERKYGPNSQYGYAGKEDFEVAPGK